MWGRPNSLSIVELALLLILFLSSAPPTANANTPGRAWSPVQIRQSSLGPTYAPRLEINPDGNPIMFGSVSGVGVKDIAEFVWNGVDWPEVLHVGRANGGFN